MVHLTQWIFGKSKADLLYELILSDRQRQKENDQKNLEMIQSVLTSVTQQSNVFADYLKLIASVGKPDVRIMSDEDEARFEELRKLQKAKQNGHAIDVVMTNPSQMDLTRLFEEIKQDMS